MTKKTNVKVSNILTWIFTPEIAKIRNELCDYLEAATGVDKETFVHDADLQEFIVRIHRQGWKDSKADTLG